ncbi:hypothetical protein CF326_g8603 [Tilletia indica]|nr:hypothetical protein CF326_g8603 [Tilletia indica]
MADYKEWPREDLLTRIAGLEALLGAHNGGLSNVKTSVPAEKIAQLQPQKPKKKQAREFDVSSQPLRKIALRFSYDGAHYSGLAAQNPSSYSSHINVTPLPTVEGVLWKALVKARLVDDAKGYDGAGWSRCGRTDRGVSAAGQVVALWVRSRRVDERALKEREDEIRRRKWEMGEREEGSEDAHPPTGETLTGADAASAAMQAANLIEQELGPRPSPILIDPDAEELPYVVSLNRILPPTIRIHAWSPVRPDFSARFDCRYRHYKYFFTAGAPPALRPSSTSTSSISQGNNLAVGSGPRLDVDAMRDAARRLLGSHDFRNLCKVDSSKQVTNFIRRVDGVGIDVVPHGHWPISPPPSSASSSSGSQDPWSTEHMYVFNLRGTAFLYHQVRHIMAVLFLVGARLEDPSIVDALVNVQQGRAARDRAAVDALRRGLTDSNEEEELGVEGARNVRDWIDWCLPGSSATDPDGHTANTRPGGPKADANDDDEAPSLDEEDGMTVFETKPMYEMAADRPLVLWECGFRPVDLSWRAGTCDEPLGGVHSLPAPVPLPPSIQEEEEAVSQPEQTESEQSGKKKKKVPPPPPARLTSAESNISASWRTTADLHTTWTTSAISTQIARHFVLAAPSPHLGTLPAWTHFLDASVPVQRGIIQESSSEETEGISPAIPIGNGLSRPHGSYVGLAKRRRGESVEVINQRWVLGRGARRAAVRGLTAEELSRGMKPRIAAGEGLEGQVREEEEER